MLTILGSGAFVLPLLVVAGIVASGLDWTPLLDKLQYANKESAVASTLAPRAAFSAVVYSAELWERPSTLGTNSIAVGRCRANAGAIKVRAEENKGAAFAHELHAWGANFFKRSRLAGDADR